MSEPTLEPAWVLHRQAYGDSGFLVELFTAQTGRLTAVARGARRKARGGAVIGLLQPFAPLLVSWSGRGELKTLKRVEVAAAALSLQGRAMFSALYVNELLTRLLPRFDPTPELFSQYGQVLQQLTEGLEAPVLRDFELALLAELGYAQVFAVDGHGDAIEPEGHYRYIPGEGFFRHTNALSQPIPPELFSGALLLEVDQALSQKAALSSAGHQVLKMINRQALDHLLGGKPLQSRELMRAFLST